MFYMQMNNFGMTIFKDFLKKSLEILVNWVEKLTVPIFCYIFLSIVFSSKLEL